MNEVFHRQVFSFLIIIIIFVVFPRIKWLFPPVVHPQLETCYQEIEKAKDYVVYMTLFIYCLFSFNPISSFLTKPMLETDNTFFKIGKKFNNPSAIWIHIDSSYGLFFWFFTLAGFLYWEYFYRA